MSNYLKEILKFFLWCLLSMLRHFLWFGSSIWNIAKFRKSRFITDVRSPRTWTSRFFSKINVLVRKNDTYRPWTSSSRLFRGPCRPVLRMPDCWRITYAAWVVGQKLKYIYNICDIFQYFCIVLLDQKRVMNDFYLSNNGKHMFYDAWSFLFISFSL